MASNICLTVEVEGVASDRELDREQVRDIMQAISTALWYSARDVLGKGQGVIRVSNASDHFCIETGL